MHVVNVTGLKNDPSEALRCARDGLVVVMTGDQPEAVMIGLQSGKLLAEPGVRAALATALFRDGGLSLARSARLAQMPLAVLIAHISRLGIAVADQDADGAQQDSQTLDEWLASSGSTPAR